MPFFERNSFVLRQLLQPGWVKRTKLASTFSIVLWGHTSFSRPHKYQPTTELSIYANGERAD